MDFSVKSGSPEKQRSACIVVGVFEARRLTPSGEAIDKVSDGYLSNILRKGDLEGKLCQTLLLHNVPNMLADRVLLVGCGKEREFGLVQYRQIHATTVKTLNETGAIDAISFLTDLNVRGQDLEWRIRIAVEASRDCLYSFDTLKSKKEASRRPLKRITFMVPTRRDLAVGEEAVKVGQIIADGCSLTRDLGNLPGNICTPSYLADRAIELCKPLDKVTVEVFEEKHLIEWNMGAYLAVTKGSAQPPKLISIQYKGASDQQKPYVLVGKGVTFDTGGISLKPAASMNGMKFDMCGAASVLATLINAAHLKLPINIVALMGCVENMPSGTATRPDDVVTSMSGQTIEIGNTDAEGRLVLCDVLTFAARYNPAVVIDVATLTGAAVIAFSSLATALFSNHKPLANNLLMAGEFTYDRAWQMPLWEEYQALIESPVADMTNTGGREGGCITAACFLSRFTKKYHWAHLDVAGSAFRTGREAMATGRPVPLLTQYLINEAKSAA
jgi:leucyl aminopeptidase